MQREPEKTPSAEDEEPEERRKEEISWSRLGFRTVCVIFIWNAIPETGIWTSCCFCLIFLLLDSNLYYMKLQAQIVRHHTTVLEDMTKSVLGEDYEQRWRGRD